MELTIKHYDYDEDNNEVETELTVDVEYTSGEAEERWGYYGATPGSPSEVEILSVAVPLEVCGPHVNRYAREYERVMYGGNTSDWYTSNITNSYNNFKCPSGPVVYMIPWDGELSDAEIENIREMCDKDNGY
jgi:hypothetical protein